MTVLSFLDLISYVFDNWTVLCSLFLQCWFMNGWWMGNRILGTSTLKRIRLMSLGLSLLPASPASFFGMLMLIYPGVVWESYISIYLWFLWIKFWIKYGFWFNFKKKKVSIAPIYHVQSHSCKSTEINAGK